MTVDNREIARLITRYADLLEIDGANPFRIRAYRAAVRYLESTAPDVAKYLAAGRDLDALPGIGKILAEKITTIVAAGALPQLAKLEERVPAGLADLMELPGLGAKRVGALYHELGVQSLADLRRALDAGRVDKLAGFHGKLPAQLADELAKRGVTPAVR